MTYAFDLALASLAVAVGAAGACAGPMASRFAAEGRLARLCARRRAVVLTYDDGPGEHTTPRLLALLRTHGARASFFALGRQAERHPALLDRVVAEGHEVGCHSYGHVHPWRAAPWTGAGDVRRGFRALAPWVGRGGLFRPPYGKLTPLSWAAARREGARFGWWTVDSGDSHAVLPRADEIAGRVRANGGGVVLLHDADRAAERVRYVLDVTAALLRAAREDGLRVVPLGALLEEEEGTP